MAGERFRLTRIADALATMCPILLLRLLKKAARWSGLRPWVTTHCNDCGRVLFGSRVAKREAEGTVHTKHQLNLDPNPEGT